MAAPPTNFIHRVTDGRITVIVNFVLHPIRSSNFQVLVQDAQGNFHAAPAIPPRTYLGHILGLPGALAAGVMRADGTVLCQISFESGLEWVDLTGSGNAIWSGATDWQPKHSNGPLVGSGGAGSQVFAAEMGIDVTSDYFLTSGSVVSAPLDMVEFSVLAANMPFLRDAAIINRLGRVVMRSSNVTDPYVASGGDPYALLATLREQWINVLPVGSTHHLVALVTPRTSVSMAHLGQIGTSLGLSVNYAHSNGDFSRVLRATAGINWGALTVAEEDAAEGPTILSGNLLSRFSSADVARILVHRDAKSALFQNLGRYSLFVVPPRVNIDHAILNAGLQVRHQMNVLANDSQSNGFDMLSLSRVPELSALGGTLQLRSSSSAASEIIYTPPLQLAPGGVDFFSYQITASDPQHSTATGYVTVLAIADDDLVAHWSLDDGIGSIAHDSSASQNNGLVTGGATWVAGHIRGAISLDGATGQVAASRGLNFSTNTITITGWVRCNGTQAAIAGLALCRDRLSGTVTNTTSAGLHLAAPSNELRYHWGTSNNPSFNFSSGLTLRDAQWTFVALAISPTQATLYKKEPQGDLEAAHTDAGRYTFEPQSFEGPFVLGNDEMMPGRHFKGDMDDFRIFRRALTQEEISLLATSSSEGVAASVLDPTRAHLIVGTSFDFTYTGRPRVLEEEGGGIIVQMAKAP